MPEEDMARWRAVVDAFPHKSLITLLGLGTAALVIGAVWSSADHSSLGLPRGGCVATILSARGELIMARWRGRVDSLTTSVQDSTGQQDQAASIFQLRVRSAEFWMHLLFVAATTTWGFGDLAFR